MKKLFSTITIILILLTTTSCFKRDDMEGINIYTTLYPIEYLTSSLYGYNSTIKSIYPDEVNPNEYTLTSKQIKDYANSSSLLIYNGLSDEKKIAASFLNNNKKIKIIDVSQSLDIDNYQEELWISPTNYLMLALNIKNGLKEYINNKYIKKEIEDNYLILKENITALEAELKIIAEGAEDKTIVTSSNMLLFLEKYGYEVISLDESKDEISQNVINKVKRLINEKTISYIFLKENDEINKVTQSLIDETKIKTATINTFNILTEEQRENNITYLNIMKENIEAIKKEMYE